MGRESDPRTVPRTEQGKETRIVTSRRCLTDAPTFSIYAAVSTVQTWMSSIARVIDAFLRRGAKIPLSKTFGSQFCVARLFRDTPELGNQTWRFGSVMFRMRSCQQIIDDSRVALAQA
jgi:hypothetical protein